MGDRVGSPTQGAGRRGGDRSLRPSSGQAGDRSRWRRGNGPPRARGAPEPRRCTVADAGLEGRGQRGEDGPEGRQDCLPHGLPLPVSGLEREGKGGPGGGHGCRLGGGCREGSRGDWLASRGRRLAGGPHPMGYAHGHTPDNRVRIADGGLGGRPPRRNGGPEPVWLPQTNPRIWSICPAAPNWRSGRAVLAMRRGWGGTLRPGSLRHAQGEQGGQVRALQPDPPGPGYRGRPNLHTDQEGPLAVCRAWHAQLTELHRRPPGRWGGPRTCEAELPSSTRLPRSNGCRSSRPLVRRSIQRTRAGLCRRPDKGYWGLAHNLANSPWLPSAPTWRSPRLAAMTPTAMSLPPRRTCHHASRRACQ